MALSDWLKPRYQHSDPQVRLAAVRELASSQTDLLAKIASTDSNEDVAVAAISLLEDPDALGRIASQDISAGVLAAITSKLDHIHYEILVGDTCRVAREAALTRIGNTEFLVQAAEAISDIDLRVATIRRISCPDQLGELLEKPIGKEAGLAALEEITDLKILAHAAEFASNKAVRHAARDRHDAIIAEQNAPDPETQRRERLLELYLLADKLQDSWNWDYATSKLNEARDEWPRWDADYSDDLWPRFEGALTNFKRRQDDFLVRQKEEAARMAARESAIAHREGLLAQLAALEGRFDQDAHDILAQLKTNWEAAPAVSGEEGDVLNERFQSDAEQFEHDAVGLAKSAKERDAVVGILTQLCENAESLLALEDTGKARAEFASLRRDWKAATADLKDLGYFATRFKTVGDSLNAKSAAEREARSAKREAACARLTTLCELVEGLLESKDRGKAQKAVRAARDEFQKLRNQDSELPNKLRRRFTKAARAFDKKQRENREAESWQRWSNLQAKEGLIEEVIALAALEDFHEAAKQLKELQAKWKTIGPVPHKENDRVWNRFREVCDATYARCKASFDAADQQRRECRQQKRDLIDRVNALAHSDGLTSASSWEESATVVKGLQADWKEIGSAGRKSDKELGEQFREAANAFFGKRTAYFDAQEKLRAQHATDKAQLCEQVETLAESADWLNSARAIQNLQAEWKEIGAAPKEEENTLWERFRGACNTFFERLDAVRPEHQAAKETLCGELETLLASEPAAWNYRQMANDIREMQRKYQAIGPADRDIDRELAKRFRSNCNDFFSKRREHIAGEQEERERNLAAKEELIYQVEALIDTSDWHASADSVKELQAKWKEIGPVPREQKDELWSQFRGACDTFFGNRNNHFAKKHNDRVDNLKKKEALCVRLEMLAKVDAPEAAPKSELSVAEQLKLAFESNWVTSGGAPNSKGGSWQSGREEVKRIQADWKKAGPVPRAQHDSITERYRRACEAFYAQRPEPRNKETPEQMVQNSKRKRALCQKVAPFADASDPSVHIRDVKRLMREWKKIGRVKSRKESEELEKRFYDVVDLVFDAAKKSDDRRLRHG